MQANGDVKHSIAELGKIMSDDDKYVVDRWKALSELRNIALNDQERRKEALDCFAAAFSVVRSALIKHEMAYSIGQVRDPYSVPILKALLTDPNENPIVRHEAGAGLGSIATRDVLTVLQQYLNDPAEEVRETCQLAVKRVEWVLDGNPVDINPLKLVDPAPASSGSNINELRATLLDPSKTLFEHYRAMFALRNDGSEEAALALADGLKHSRSALFRHEAGFVLGSMKQSAAVPAMVERLNDVNESPMVRHEVVTGLSAFGTPECLEAIRQHTEDPEPVVRESCILALHKDMVAF